MYLLLPQLSKNIVKEFKAIVLQNRCRMNLNLTCMYVRIIEHN